MTTTDIICSRWITVWLGLFDVSVYFEPINTAPFFVELDESLSPVWTMQIFSFVEDSVDLTFWEYHVERMTIYNASADDLQIGEAATVILSDAAAEELGVESTAE